jgi:YesN/AraC family two-component response regulator
MKQRMSQSRLLASSNLISPERLFQPIWHFDRNRFAKVLDTLDQRLIMESVRIEIASMAKTSVDSEMILRLYFEIGNILLNKGVDHLSDSSLEREQFIRHLYNFGNMASPEELLSWSSQIISIWCSIMTQKRNGTINSFTTATRNYIEKNFARNLSLTEIADYLHIHPNYLSKLFHEKEGMTITEYVQKCRMEKALELLKVTGIKVYEVADQIGYASLSHFIRVFKKTYGLNPKNWQSST